MAASKAHNNGCQLTVMVVIRLISQAVNAGQLSLLFLATTLHTIKVLHLPFWTAQTSLNLASNQYLCCSLHDNRC